MRKGLLIFLTCRTNLLRGGGGGDLAQSSAVLVSSVYCLLLLFALELLLYQYVKHSPPAAVIVLTASNVAFCLFLKLIHNSVVRVRVSAGEAQHLQMGQDLIRVRGRGVSLRQGPLLLSLPWHPRTPGVFWLPTSVVGSC